VDEHALARPQGPVVEEGLPRRQGRQRDGGGLDVRERGGLGRELAGVGPDGNVLRVSTVTADVRVAEDLVADGEAGRIGPDRLDDPRDLVARDDRRHAGRGIMVEPRPRPVQLARAHAAGVHPDQDILRAEPGRRRLLVDEAGGVARGVGAECEHQRSDRKAARTSAVKSSGSSQAAKWPPRSTSLKYVVVG